MLAISERARGGRLRRWATWVVAATLVGVTGGGALAATITNGNFATGLLGWTQVHNGTGAWERITFTGPFGRLSNGFTVPVDPGQAYAVGTSQFGPGDHLLYQDVGLESNAAHLLSLHYRWQNWASRFHTPNSLSYTTFPNQQARIDVIKPTAPVNTLAAGDILATVTATTTSSPLTIGWTHATVDLSPFAGQMVRLRLAEVDNQGHFTLDVTDIAMTSTPLNQVPTVSVTGVADGADYEFGAVPAAGCSVVDAEDGSTATPAMLSAITGPRSAAGLGSQTASCTYTDTGGLTATASATYAIVDTTAPTLTVPAPQAAEATGPGGAQVTYPAPSAEDLVDGAVATSCDHHSGDVFSLGTTTVTCTAEDAVGNEATGSFGVTVAYAWSGVQAPLASGAGYRLGRTLPVKFTLTGGGGPITDATAGLYLTKLSDTTPIESAATSTSAADADNAFRWTGSHYLFNLATEGLTAGTWQLRIDLGDGVLHTETIVLR